MLVASPMSICRNERAALPSLASSSREQAPALPAHIQAVGTHHRITKGSGYYWIGPAQSELLNEQGHVLKGIVLYNATNCLFLERDETQEAIEEAQQMLQTFFQDMSESVASLALDRTHE